MLQSIKDYKYKSKIKLELSNYFDANTLKFRIFDDFKKDDEFMVAIYNYIVKNAKGKILYQI